MPSKKVKRQADIDRLSSLGEGDAERLFGGDKARGFLFWGIKLYLEQAQSEPTQDDLIGCITDGAGDLEIDAYHVDEEGRTIYLFQAKYSENPENIKRRNVSDFIGAPARLANPHFLIETYNDRILEFAPVFRERILDGYEITLVFLSTQAVTQQITNEAEAWNKRPLTLCVGGEEIGVEHRLDIHDGESLLDMFDATDDISPLDLPLHLVGDRWHMAPTTDKIRCLVATIEVQELVEIFDRHRFRIFKDNPRGPLGARGKVNKAIAETLQSEVELPRFHLLNNGLSAVCQSFKDPYPDNGGFITHVMDLQIVNGCQTTYALWDQHRRGFDLSGAYVTLKLVETPNLQRDISKASNSQSQMVDWDFLFNDPEQVRLQKEFAQLHPRVFYEFKRGEYRYMQKEKVQRVTIKDIAQSTWAFIGKPGEAKDKIRFVPRSKDTDSGYYNEVFYDKVPAAHLWLCWVVYSKVYEEHRKYLNDPTRKGDVNTRKGDYRAHGRLHILWLMGRAILELTGSSAYKDISVEKVKALTTTIDQWFMPLHDIAVNTVRDVIRVEQRVAEKDGKSLQLRPLFRSSAMYKDFEEVHDEHLQRSDRLPTLV